MAKCQVLKSSGKRCGRDATYRIHYFGDNELYHQSTVVEDEVYWVEVKVCTPHMESNRATKKDAKPI